MATVGSDEACCRSGLRCEGQGETGCKTESVIQEEYRAVLCFERREIQVAFRSRRLGYPGLDPGNPTVAWVRCERCDVGWVSAA
jgi:hypothetical protein